MLPYLISTAKTPIVTYDALFACYCLKELFIGTVIAFLVGILLHCTIFRCTHRLLTRIFCFASARSDHAKSKLIDRPALQLCLYRPFLRYWRPFIFFEGVLNSYSVIPADSFIPVAFFSLQMPFWQFMMGLLTKFLAISLQLAAPSLVAILMAEMFLGIANRLALKFNCLPWYGAQIVCRFSSSLAGWYFILQQIGKQSIVWLQTLNQLIYSIAK